MYQLQLPLAGSVGPPGKVGIVPCCPVVTTKLLFFFFQAEDGIRDYKVAGVQTCALPIFQEVLLTVDAARRLVVAMPPQHGLAAEARELDALVVQELGEVAALAGQALRVGDRESVVEGKRVDLGGGRVI